MRLKGFSLLLGVGLLLATAAASATSFAIVPKPQHVTAGQGSFVLRNDLRIAAPADARAQWIAGFLRRSVAAQTGIDLHVVKAPARAAITLRINAAINGKEAYRLDVTPTGIVIAAADNRGLFWGVQTLRQLLPLKQATSVRVPAVRIADAPHYAWRGIMLDTARHFYPVGFIKKQIALMSYYKFDVFHWHLTDDQGWRIQIKKYPKLTGVGAWRTEPDGKRYGGYYTQQQIRDVVAWAKARNVMVVPEIEMPGHSSAAIAAYPDLSCSHKPIKVPTAYGVLHNVDCIDAHTFAFLDNVLDEVMTLFPSPYVHIGGDEVPQGVWADCAPCKKLGQLKDIHGETGLHSYFVAQMQQFLAGKGKTMIGWDEILEGGVSPDAIVEVWRGETGAKQAFANGNRIILAGPFYMDAPIDGRTLQDVYRDNPFDTPLYQSHAKLVLGGEAPLWSERATALNADARLYPRVLAVVEHLWNPAAHDWKDFLRRVRAQEAWLAARHVAYGPEAKDIVDYRLGFNPGYHRWRIRAARGFADLRLHYTLDGSQPTVHSPSFGDVLDLYQPATVTVAPFRGDVQYQASETFQLVPNLALGKPVHYAAPPSGEYDGGALQLVNGILGSTNFHDGNWSGWQGADMDATIDLQQPTPVHVVKAGFLQEQGSWIFLPKSVRLEVSNDGKTWRTVDTINLPRDSQASSTRVRTLPLKPAKPVTTRYVRVVAAHYGQPVRGLDPWIFCDELAVQ
ncbi:MAG TPA: family 20 glycosylhydrolase [Rhodanobacteraceae bacterium]